MALAPIVVQKDSFMNSSNSVPANSQSQKVQNDDDLFLGSDQQGEPEGAAHGCEEHHRTPGWCAPSVLSQDEREREPERERERESERDL